MTSAGLLAGCMGQESTGEMTCSTESEPDRDAEYFDVAHAAVTSSDEDENKSNRVLKIVLDSFDSNVDAVSLYGPDHNELEHIDRRHDTIEFEHELDSPSESETVYEIIAYDGHGNELEKTSIRRVCAD